MGRQNETEICSILQVKIVQWPIHVLELQHTSQYWHEVANLFMFYSILVNKMPGQNANDSEF